MRNVSAPTLRKPEIRNYPNDLHDMEGEPIWSLEGTLILGTPVSATPQFVRQSLPSIARAAIRTLFRSFRASEKHGSRCEKKSGERNNSGNTLKMLVREGGPRPVPLPFRPPSASGPVPTDPLRGGLETQNLQRTTTFVGATFRTRCRASMMHGMRIIM